VVPVTEDTELVDEDEDAAPLDDETEEDEGAVVDAELDVELVLEVVLLEPDNATYAPTMMTRTTITTMPIIAPLARALLWP